MQQEHSAQYILCRLHSPLLLTKRKEGDASQTHITLLGTSPNSMENSELRKYKPTSVLLPFKHLLHPPFPTIHPNFPWNSVNHVSQLTRQAIAKVFTIAIAKPPPPPPPPTTTTTPYLPLPSPLPPPLHQIEDESLLEPEELLGKELYQDC